MLSDIANFRRLDRFQQIGRGCQVAGVAFILGPTLGAIIRATAPTPTSSSLLDPLPSYNPSVFALHHPGLVALITAALGLPLVAIGSGFLATRPWALVAMRRACWAAASISVVVGALWAFSLLGLSNLATQAFGVASVLVTLVFALLFWRVGRELKKREYAVRFHAATSE